MTRTIPSSLAVAAMLSMATADRAVSQDSQTWQKNFETSSPGKSGKSAQKGYEKGFIADSFGFGVEREMKESKKARGLRRKSRR